MNHELGTQAPTHLQRFNQVFDLLNGLAKPVREDEYWKSIPETGIYIYNPRERYYSQSIYYEPAKAYAKKKCLDPESPFFRPDLFDKSATGLDQIELVAGELLKSMLNN